MSHTETVAAQAEGGRAQNGRNGFTFTFDAIGTQWRIDTDEPLSESVRERALVRIEEFDLAYSRFRPDSLASRVAAAPEGGRFEFPEDSLALFDLYDRLVAVTGGAVDPLVGRDLEFLGYDVAYSLAPVPEAVRAQERALGRPGRRTSSGKAGH